MEKLLCSRFSADPLWRRQQLLSWMNGQAEGGIQSVPIAPGVPAETLSRENISVLGQPCKWFWSATSTCSQAILLDKGDLSKHVAFSPSYDHYFQLILSKIGTKNQ